MPASAFDLKNWKLQVPYSSSGSFTSGTAAEIKQPELDSYSYDNLFYLKKLSDGSNVIVMRTPVQGVTTSGSIHPRVELREMKNSGSTDASWGTNDGKTHTLSISQTVTHLPSVTNRTTVF